MEDGLSDLIREFDEINRRTERELDLLRQLNAEAGNSGGSAAPGSLVPSGDSGVQSLLSQLNTNIPGTPSIGGLAGALTIGAGIGEIVSRVVGAMMQQDQASGRAASIMGGVAESGFEFARARRNDLTYKASRDIEDRRDFINAPVEKPDGFFSVLYEGDNQEAAAKERAFRQKTYDLALKYRNTKYGQLRENQQQTIMNAGNVDEAKKSNEVNYQMSYAYAVGNSTRIGEYVWNAGKWAWQNTAGRLSGGLDDERTDLAMSLAARRVSGQVQSIGREVAAKDADPATRAEILTTMQNERWVEHQRNVQFGQWNQY